MGLVYVAVAGLGTPEVRRYLWPGDRSANKRDSAVAAIELLLARVEAAPHGGQREPCRGCGRASAAGPGSRPRCRSPDPAGERIHVVGAAGAGASAAALLAAWAGCVGRRLRPRRPAPYTPALVAAGIHVADRHDAGPRARRRPAAPARLAVTKALTAIDPDNPELAAARAAGIPLEAWQQVVADAAARRTLVAVAGTHGKSTTSGWLVGVLAAGGADPGAFVGALLPGVADRGRAAGNRAAGRGGAVRRRGGRVRRQLRRLPARRRGPDLGRVGPPRRVRGPRRGARRVRGVDPRAGRSPGRRARHAARARGERGRRGRRRARGAAGRLARPDRRDRARGRGSAAGKRVRPRDRGAVPHGRRARRGAARPDHRLGPRGDDARRSSGSTRSSAR